MPVDVKRLLLGIALIGLSIYVGLDPNSLFSTSPFVKVLAGGIFFSTITLFFLEAGFTLTFFGEGNTFDTVCGIFYLVMFFAIGGGFGWNAYTSGRMDLIIPVLIGAAVYWGLVRAPIYRLVKPYKLCKP